MYICRVIRYEGKLGDLEITLTVPGTGLLHKGHLTVMGPPDDTGTRRGYWTNISRRELLEFVELMRRML